MAAASMPGIDSFVMVDLPRCSTGMGLAWWQLPQKPPLKRFVIFLFEACCLFIVAAGILAVLISSFAVAAMVIVRCTQGALLDMDRYTLGKAVEWLLGSVAVVAVTWFVRLRVISQEGRDDSLRLAESKHPRRDDLVQFCFEIGFFVLLTVSLWGSSLAPPVIKLTIVGGCWSLVFFALHARILIHELGHLFTARALGFQLRKLQVGIGPLLWSHMFNNGLCCEWRLSSRAGFVIAFPRDATGYRARQLLMVLAGPAADGLLIWLGYELIARFYGGLVNAYDHGPVGLTVFGLFWWTVLSALNGLIPHKMRISYREIWTDGYSILCLCTASSEEIAKLARAIDPERAIEMLRSNAHPSQPQESDGPDLDSARSLQNFREQQSRLNSRLRSVS